MGKIPFNVSVLIAFNISSLRHIIIHLILQTSSAGLRANTTHM